MCVFVTTFEQIWFWWFDNYVWWMYVTNMCEEHGNRGTETNFIILDKFIKNNISAGWNKTETLPRWKDIDWWQNYSAEMRLPILRNLSFFCRKTTTFQKKIELGSLMKDLREGCYYPSNKMSSVNILPLETLNKCGHLDQELCGSKLFPSISVTAPENVIHITECQEGKWSQ